MNKRYLNILFVFLFALYMPKGMTQVCDSLTPVFNVNLSGQPNGTWTSPPVLRDGNCCATDNNCIEFIIILDSNANGILFDIVSGALPGGALFYQINCGPLQSVGNPVCLSGPGPHILTFCKPGNNLNVYQIASIPKPSAGGTQWVSEACEGELHVMGLIDTSIQWTSVPFNAVYNSFLSCSSGCDSVTITPSGIVPAYVDYQVCGYVIGGCIPFYYCDTMRVNFVNTLAVNITPQNPVICFGGPNVTVTANVTGGLSPFSYLWNNGSTTQSISVGPGTYIVQIADSMGCSTSTDTVVVTALALPISANAGPDQLFCINQQSIVLNGIVTTADGGLWLGGGGKFTPDDTTLNANYVPSSNEINAGSVLLTLITTGNYNCPPDTDQVLITISPNPVPVITGDTVVCEYITTTYTAPLLSGINYTWNVTGGTIVSANSNSISVHWNNSGIGTITLTATNALSCDSTKTINIAIEPKPVPVINGPFINCTFNSSTYALSNPDPNNTYNWTVTGGGTIIGSPYTSQVNILWYNPGSATITMTESNMYGCDSTVSIPVTVLVQPAPLITGPTTVCGGQVATYTTGFVLSHTYSWNVTGGSILSVVNNSITIQWTNMGIGSVTVTQYNTSLCDSTATLNVVINPQPVPVIIGPSVICNNTISQYTLANPNSNNSYNWYVSGGIITGSSTGNSLTVLWQSTGNGTVMVTEANNLGCDSTVSIPVTILYRPIPDISGPDNLCESDTATYSVPYVPGDSYFWNVTNGSIININVSNQIVVLWSVAGTGEVSLRQVSPFGCDSLVNQIILVKPKPQSSILGPAVLCENEGGIYTISTYNGNFYNWTLTGGTINGSSSEDSVWIFWTTSGAATLFLTETTLQGCSSSVSYPVQINSKPHPLIVGDQVGCVAQQLGNYSTVTEPGILYQWQVSGGSIISGNGTGAIEVQWTLPGTQTVTVRAINPNTGCDSTVTLSVLTDSLAQPVIQANSLTGCAPLNALFSGNTMLNDYQYQWSFGDGFTASSPNPSHEYNLPGTYQVLLVLTNQTGCSDTAKAQVTAYSLPVADFELISGPGPYLIDRSTIALENQSNGAINYLWNFGNGDSSTEFEPVYQYMQPGHYAITLLVTNQWGCQDRTSRYLEVKVPEDLYIPNAFTPNGDGKNDHFSIGTQNIVGFKISIYNRWGENIYISYDPGFTWDGSFHGQKVPEDAYVFVISATGYHGKSFKRKGTVALIR